MSRTSYFSNAEVTIGDHANFQTVGRDAISVTNNYQCTHGEGQVVVGGRTIRRILDGDINYQRVLSSQVLSVSIGTGEQTAEIVQYPGKFTTTTLEPVDVNDQDKVKTISRRVLAAGMCRRSALLVQLFAVVDSDPLTLIAHNELVEGYEWVCRYKGKNRIVYDFLDYTFGAAVQSLHDDEILNFPVTSCFNDWSFNVKTFCWHFDPAAIVLSPPNQRLLRPYYNHYTPLRQGNLRQLDADNVIACVEENLGDFLILVASTTGRWFNDLSLSKYARHGLLTFGTVIKWDEPGILAHLPSTAPLERFCQSYNAAVEASFSTSVPWRVNLSFRKTGNIQVDLDFGLRISGKDRDRHQAAYLCQSLSFIHDCNNVERVVYINQIGFRLRGIFYHDPATRSMPAFLFCSFWPTKYINNMHSIQYPLRDSPFYWSLDRKGKSRIAEADWERFNIPKLELKTWIGSYWTNNKYNIVQDVLRSRNYSLDGGQYAREHGHPKLIQGDPHDTGRFKELEQPGSIETLH